MVTNEQIVALKPTQKIYYVGPSDTYVATMIVVSAGENGVVVMNQSQTHVQFRPLPNPKLLKLNCFGHIDGSNFWQYAFLDLQEAKELANKNMELQWALEEKATAGYKAEQDRKDRETYEQLAKKFAEQ